MRFASLLLSTLALSAPSRTQTVVFDQYFVDKTLRIDYHHVGNAVDETVTIDRLYEQGTWAGNPTHLIDPFGMGRYAVKVYDVSSNRLIYSRGYDSYFGEYRTTEPAKNGVQRTFHETVLIPFPKHRILVVFEMRDSRNIYHPKWNHEVDPADYHIVRDPVKRGDEIIESVKSADPHRAVDIVIMSEGYTSGEKAKFDADMRRYCDILFSVEPYKSNRKRFNITGIFVPSPESGVDEPRQGVYRKTFFGCTFNSLDSDRYLTTEENKLVRDVAAQVPYDIMMIMVNSKRYGGGGFYGNYSDFTADGTWNDYVFHHEFGHAFAGLGDEYYTSDVATSEFYPEGVEPVDPNLTALLDPVALKWKDLLSPGISVPTEWGQRTFDSLGTARDTLAKERAEKVRELKRRGAGESEIKKVTAEFDARVKKLGDEVIAFMENHPLRGKTGAFQGGGYRAKGLYRPTVNSIMHQFNKSDRIFFGVSERAITRMIEYFAE